MSKLSYLINITGQVQGVGFRPFIYSLVHDFNYKGWINNNSSGVSIFIDCVSDISNFILAIKDGKPSLAVIEEIIVEQTDHVGCVDFQIVESIYNSEDGFQVMLTPDCAICSTCRKEFLDKNNRRHYYPFITCTECGPRQSIIKALPFDRINTSMNTFVMCEECEREYKDPLDRRFYSQTNSCPNCTIKLSGSISDSVQCIRNGGVLAIKGLGGYMLMGDATNESVVAKIRSRKSREYKPLALMVRDIEVAKSFCDITNFEAEALLSKEAPIVLCRKSNTYYLPNNIVYGLSSVGLLLPYTPMHLLLMESFNIPLIATSANCSGNPIIYEENKELLSLADYVLGHNRNIEFSQDDSLVCLTSKGQRIIMRRARGFSSNFWNRSDVSCEDTLALGGDLKHCFAYNFDKQIYVSPFEGDLVHWKVQERFVLHLKKFLKMYDRTPRRIVCDSNNTYFSHQIAKDLSSEFNIELITIQHHRAHYMAVLADNNVVNNSHEILGVIWDGAGLGEDGLIWGGEFFLGNERVDNIREYPYLMGDKMSKEPSLSLFSLTKGESSHPNSSYLRKHLASNSCRYTTSMGRLIDAVSCLLTDIEINQYESQAAITLEQLADETLIKRYFVFEDYYNEYPLDPYYLVHSISNDLGKYDNGYLACKFFSTLVYWIDFVAIKQGVDNIAFSGGVFQNRVLVELLTNKLGEKYKLLFHKHTSPNDENISLGAIQV